MAKYAKAFSITGVANTAVEDKGISSSEADHKHLEKIIINLTGHAGNKIEVWFEREKFFEIYDYNLDTSEAASTNVLKSTTKLNEIEIDSDIPIGKTIQAVIRCGATAKDVYGSYVYHLVG